MERIMAGEIERIEVDEGTTLEIKYSEKFSKPMVGVRGPGLYLFTDHQSPDAAREK